MYEINEYITKDGISPFTEWLESLKDARARAKIRARLDRVMLGNFGDYKSVTDAKGILELRDHYGAGHRIYFHIVGNKIILLLAGSLKRDQKKTINKSKEYLADYLERSKNDETQ